MNRLYVYICENIRKMSDVLKSILEHATSQGYKSNVIKPLMGVMILFICGAIFAGYLGVIFLSIILTVFVCIFGLGFGFAYFYCLFKSPDLLRSEKYNLEKTAIEKVAVIGDSGTRMSVLMPHSDYVIDNGEQNQGITENNE